MLRHSKLLSVTYSEEEPTEESNSGKAVGGAGLDEEKVDCYCLEKLFVNVFIQTASSDEGKVDAIDGLVEVYYGAGCEEDPCHDFEDEGLTDVEVAGDKGNRTYSFSYNKCMDCGHCEPAEKGDLHSDSDPCFFKYGYYVKNVTELCDSLASDTGGGAESAGCQFVRTLLESLDYAVLCDPRVGDSDLGDPGHPSNSPRRRIKWCKDNPVDWKGNLVKQIEKFLDDNDINLRGCDEVHDVCDGVGGDPPPK